MAREHLLVCKNPEEGATKWVMAMGSGQPLRWQLSANASKRVWIKTAIEMVIARDLAVDLTISTAPPMDAMTDPDTVPPGYQLSLMCREGVRSSKRWTVLIMDRTGEFRLNSIEAGRDIHRLLQRIADEATDTINAMDNSILWMRPDLHAEDLVPEQLASRPRSAA